MNKALRGGSRFTQWMDYPSQSAEPAGLQFRSFLGFKSLRQLCLRTVSFIILTSFLSACKDDNSSVPEATDSQKGDSIDKDLHQFNVPTPPPPVVVEEEPEPSEPEVAPITFPDPAPLMRESRVRQLRGLRQWQAHQAERRLKPSSPFLRYRLSDPDYQEWDPQAGEDKSTYPVDRSRILTADTRISAILEDSVNSQLPGRVIAVIDRDVLSPNRKYVLLPAYTKLICRYESLEKVGNSRLSVSCDRAIRPDGVSIMLTHAIASDQMGRTGLVGEVDNRVWQRYGAAFVMASLSALSQAGSNVTSSQTFGSSANVLSQNLGQVTAKVLDQYLDLAPTITIAAGSRIQIIPYHDIHLRAPMVGDSNQPKGTPMQSLLDLNHLELNPKFNGENEPHQFLDHPPENNKEEGVPYPYTKQKKSYGDRK
jgi:type IV secretion system protein VirB10